MRRIDLINAVNNINAALEDSNLVNTFGGKEASIDAQMRSFQLYSTKHQTFGNIEKEVLAIFGLAHLNEAKFWSHVLTGSPEAREVARDTNLSIKYFRKHLPSLLELLKQHNVEYEKYHQAITETTHDNNKELLTVILPESESQISHPDRLVKILDSINQLYRVLATLFEYKEDDLSVAAIDSGSDKSFDFLGAAKVMAALKDLILGIWDRVVFHRERKASERIDLIIKTLPIIDQISTLEQEEKIGKEQAEILKRNVVTGVQNFISTGAIIPGFESHIQVNPKVLMAPEPKLLSATASVTEDQGTSDSEKENLSEEEQELLKELLRKKKGEN